MKRLSIVFALMLAFQAALPSAHGIWFDCWDCPYQCHGDTDCQYEGPYRVGTQDLDRFRALLGRLPLYYPDVRYDPCLDFDRDLDIDSTDQAILADWLYVTNVPGDCPGRISLKAMSPMYLAAESSCRIEWVDLGSEPACEGEVMLDYSTDDGQSWLWLADVCDCCHYDWVVPDANSQQCWISISYVGSFGYALTDMGERFTIYPCGLATTSDLDNSCYVDFGDYAIIAAGWLAEDCNSTNEWCGGADMDHSGAVDANDIRGFVTDWCDCGNPYDPRCQG